MPEGNSQSITGDGNVGVSNISDSTVTVINHNYGLQPAPQLSPEQVHFFNSIQGFSCRQYPLPELYRVNCDREQYLKLLRTHNKSNYNHLLYFILACPEQEPDSLVKHFVFDLIEENGSSDSSLKFKREKEGERSISIGTKIGGHTEFEDLRKEWLALFKKDDVDFRSFVETELPEQKLQYAIHAFVASIDEIKMENFQPIVSSFLDAFKLKVSKGPKCILFFVIYAPYYYSQDNNMELEELNILNYLKDLSHTSSNQVLFIDSLPKVEIKYLKKWFHKVFKGGDDPIHIFRKWVKKQYKKKIAVESDLINMSTIQKFQETLWNNRSRLNDH